MKPKLLLPFALALIFATSNAQWTQMNGPNVGVITSIASNGSDIFASVNYNGSFCFIYHSADSGLTWKDVSIDSSSHLITTSALMINGTNIFAGTYARGIYLSSDNGNSWTQINNGLTYLYINTLAASGTNIFAGTDLGVFLSTNNGSSWTAVNNGLSGQPVNTLATNGTDIFAGTHNGGAFLSSNNGGNWLPINNGLASTNINAFAFSGTNIFAGTNNSGVYLSTNNGSNWTGLSLPINSVTSFAVSGTDIFAGSKNNGIFLSSDTGSTWTAVNSGLTSNHVTSLGIMGSRIFTGTNSGFFISDNNGINWINSGCPALRINAFAQMGANLFCGGYNNDGFQNGGIFLSTDSGINWSIKNNGLPSYDLDVRAFAVNGTQVFAGIFGHGIFLSNDTGNTWLAVNNGITNDYVGSIIVNGTKIFAGSGGFGASAVFLSTDTGTTWSDLQYPYTSLSQLAIVGSNLFASGPEMLMLPDTGNTWIPKNNGLPGTYINAVYAGGGKLFANPVLHGVYMSSDTGNTWTLLNNGLPYDNSYIFCGAFDGFNYFLGVFLESQDSLGVYISTDNCNSWIKINDGLMSPQITSLTINGNDILAGTFASVFKRSISEILTTVSMDEIKYTNSDFYIYPNPIKNSFIIQLNSKIIKGFVEIFNVFGENVYRENIFNSSFKNIHLKNVSSGIYFVKVFDGEKSYCKKLIVEND